MISAFNSKICIILLQDLIKRGLYHCGMEINKFFSTKFGNLVTQKKRALQGYFGKKLALCCHISRKSFLKSPDLDNRSLHVAKL
jgi:hypothetical protein